MNDLVRRAIEKEISYLEDNAYRHRLQESAWMAEGEYDDARESARLAHGQEHDAKILRDELEKMS